MPELPDAFGQEHIFAAWGSLSVEQQQGLLDQVRVCCADGFARPAVWLGVTAVPICKLY
jgi:hypothetical protein